jgi:hypothetical protein
MLDNNMPSTESDAGELRSILLATAPGRHDNFVVRHFALGNFLLILKAATDADISSLLAPSLELTEAAEGASALRRQPFQSWWPLKLNAHSQVNKWLSHLILICLSLRLFRPS